jgi:hypothetical protein
MTTATYTPSPPKVFSYQACSLGLLASLAWIPELTNPSALLFGTAAKWLEGILETGAKRGR